MIDLPQGWADAILDDVTSDIVGGGTPSKANQSYFEGEIPFMTVKDMKLRFPSDTQDKITPEALSHSSARMIPAGTNIIATRMGLGKAVRPLIDVAINQDLKAVFPTQAVDADFLHWKLIQSAPYFLGLGTGTTVKGVRLEHVRALPIPLPPLPEQRRIVAKVDGLTARTAHARKELNRIPTLIARYKQRLLALAFSGELTAGWRKVHPAKQTLLEKVRTNRKTDNRLARRKRAAVLPEYYIPETWSWISPDEVAADAKYSIGIGPFGSNLVRTDYRESGVRLVFVRDIRREKFESTDARYVDESKAAELHQHVASPGDVLITKMGDPPGDSSLFPMDAEPAIITADCIKLTPHDQLATAIYLNFAIRSEIVQSQFKAITAGVAQQKVSLDRFRQLALPVAPLQEQAEIVRRIESAFGWLDRMAADHAAAVRLLPKLDAAILSKAFRGELVPQDPNDEPASALLERIKMEREAEGKIPKGKCGEKSNEPKAQTMTEKNLSPRDRLLKDSEAWPAVGFPFEAIAMRNSIPHDALRDAMFELLSGPSPALQQRFDTDAEVMVIQRVPA